MRLTLLLFVVVVAVVVGAPSPARAAPDLDPDTEVARRHFEKGRRFYEAADYTHALAEFETARKVKPLPAFDFNIARCLDRMERYPEAIAAYRKYVASAPNPFDAEEAQSRIRELAPRVEPPAKAVREKPPSPRSNERGDRGDREDHEELVRDPGDEPAERDGPPRTGSRLTVPAIVVGVVAVASAAMGAGLVLSVGPDYDALRASCGSRCEDQPVNDLRTRANAGYALLGAGGALAAADLVLWILAARRPRDGRTAEPRGNVVIAPTVNGFVVAGQF